MYTPLYYKDSKLFVINQNFVSKFAVFYLYDIITVRKIRGKNMEKKYIGEL
jgi:hypothetical protein